MHLYVDLKEQWWFKVKNFSVLLKVEKVNWQIYFWLALKEAQHLP